MNEKQKEQLRVATYYGVCNGKYLGELIDQIRMAGMNKNNLRQLCHIIACNAKDSVDPKAYLGSMADFPVRSV